MKGHKSFKEMIAERDQLEFEYLSGDGTPVDESSLSRLWKHHMEHPCGTISAFRHENTKEENIKLTQSLKYSIGKRGYSYTLIKGHFPEKDKEGKEHQVEELSFFVVDEHDQGYTLLETLLELGKQYKQESITFALPGEVFDLYDTSKELKSAIASRKPLGKFTGGNSGIMGYSVVKGRPFVFERIYDSYYAIPRINLAESSLSRIWKKHKESDSGTISACRGNLTKEENKKRTLELKTLLIKAGYSVTAVNGVYIENYNSPDAREVHEKSFIVFDYKNLGTLKQDLIKFGKKFDQDSITYSEQGKDYYLIGTNRTGYPGMNVEIKLGKPMFGTNGEFFSTVKGRPFVFEHLSQDPYSYDCRLYSYNISTILCLKKMENFVLSE